MICVKNQEKSDFLFALCIFSKSVLLTNGYNLLMYSFTTCKCYHKESLPNIELKHGIYYYKLYRSRMFHLGLFRPKVSTTFMLIVINLFYRRVACERGPVPVFVRKPVLNI